MASRFLSLWFPICETGLLDLISFRGFLGEIHMTDVCRDASGTGVVIQTTSGGINEITE